MRDPIVIPPGAGEVVGDAPDRRVEILSEADVLHATWARFGPRRAGADLHVHRRHTDLFYVLEGELTVMLGADGDDVAVPAGTLARVPAGVVHGFRNGTDAEVRYLNLHAPGVGFADYMRALRDGRRVEFDQWPPPADGGRPVTDAVVGGDVVVDGGVLLADVDEIAIAETSIDAAAPASRHVHARHVESFFVLAGELVLTAGERELRAGSGSWVQVPAGVPHAVSVAGDEPARVLDLHTPGCGFGAFLRGDAAAFDQQPGG